ncbi:sensor domain-containing diguanylate cyclase [Shewanella sp. Isolate13]|uniref:sensor domain-containing diguanylate cyclase n=1 Tax=Shewanella sp. Isolate13 TaxID=2908531 RepID=UPI001EFD464B|nr:sensor domain-containing diguanylate cyclase [Shewanella sp. Isolate13]MCG9728369.1 sensor domain-containing diguanylate cyclase [Shewanella sp. Isolate13]
MKNSPVYTTDIFLLDNPNDLISLDKWQKTVNLLAKLFDAPAGFLVQYTKEGFQVTIASEQGSNPYASGVVIEPEVNIFCRKIVETGQSLYVNNAVLDPSWDTNPEVHNDGFRSYLGVPVFWPCGTAFGTFCVMDYKATDYQKTYIELITQLKELLESDLALIGCYAQMQQLAITDPLCDVNNRRGFNVLAEQRIKLAKRNDGLQGLLYLDIDRFKEINDLHGHGVGDLVLKAVARILSQSVAESDVVGRLGGDEFVALVAVKDMVEIDGLKQRIMHAIELCHCSEELPRFTVSIGYSLVSETIDICQLLDSADQDMLQHKQRIAG